MPTTDSDVRVENMSHNTCQLHCMNKLLTLRPENHDNNNPYDSVVTHVTNYMLQNITKIRRKCLMKYKPATCGKRYVHRRREEQNL